MGFWTFGSYIGKGREIADLKSHKARHQSNLDHKISSWKISEEEIAKIDKRLAELEEDTN